jgi:peroxiredoxin
MTRCVPLGVFILAIAASAPASAGKFNKKISVGDAAPSFRELPGVDGKRYSSSDFKDQDVLVLVLTCNHCPVAAAYEDRIIDFAKRHASQADSKVAVVAISVSNLEADKLPKMRERAKEKRFNFPYLHDESQEMGRALGVTMALEFFVLNKDRKVVYLGAMDDDQDSPTRHYLDAAVSAAIKGERPQPSETRPRGCPIKYETSSASPH